MSIAVLREGKGQLTRCLHAQTSARSVGVVLIPECSSACLSRRRGL